MDVFSVKEMYFSGRKLACHARGRRFESGHFRSSVLQSLFLYSLSQILWERHNYESYFLLRFLLYLFSLQILHVLNPLRFIRLFGNTGTYTRVK